MPILVIPSAKALSDFVSRHLHEQPRHHCVGDRDFVNSAPLQLAKKDALSLTDWMPACVLEP
jgi:hypothetical protein